MPVDPQWARLPLSEVALVQTGLAKGKSVDARDAVELPYLRVANVQDGFVDLSEMKTIAVERANMERYALKPGDVLFTEGGDADKLGRGCVWRGEISPCLHQNHVFAVRPDATRLLPEFLANYAASRFGKAYFLNCAKQTTNLASINSTQLKAFPVPLPPLSEQRKIVAVLSSVDETIEKTAAIIDQLEAVKNSLLSELLTSGIPRQYSAFKETEIGRIPVGWQVLALGDLLSAIEAGWSPQCEPRLAEESEWGVLKVSAISSGDYVSGEHKTLPSALEPRPEIEVKPGDVLIARANGVLALVGRSAFVHSTRPRLMLSDKTLRLRPNTERLDGFFLHLMLGFDPVRTQVVEGTTGSHMRNVSQAALRRVLLPVPPLDEQRSIAATMLGIDSRATAEREEIRGLRVVKAVLLDALISGRIRVNILVQEAA